MTALIIGSSSKVEFRDDIANYRVILGSEMTANYRVILKRAISWSNGLIHYCFSIASVGVKVRASETSRKSTGVVDPPS